MCSQDPRLVKLLAGMFDPNRTIAEQVCTPPGHRLGVKIDMDTDRSLRLASDSGQPSNQHELEVMLHGGHRNRIIQPVSSASRTTFESG